MRSVIVIFMAFVMFSCGSELDSSKVADPIFKPTLSKDSKVFLGNRLFSEKTCIKCHDVDRKKIGPSVIEIMTVYKEKKGDIVQFLKGNAKPIVDTIPEEVAIMQENIEGFLKNISDIELEAIATYMLHVDELSLGK